MSSEQTYFIELSTSSEDIKPFLVVTLNTLNETGFFYPKLSTGGLFELFNMVMIDHTSLHGGDYNVDAVSENMELFYTTQDEQLSDNIANALESLTDIAYILEKYDLSAKLSVDVEKHGSFTVEFPISQELYYEEFPENLEQSHEDSGAHPQGLFTNRRITPDGEDISPKFILTTMLILTNDLQQESPELFGQPLRELEKADEDSIKITLAQIEMAIDILSDLSDYQHEPHWDDIVRFINNEDDVSLMIFTNYLAKKHEELAFGVIPVIRNYPYLIFLQSHFVRMSSEYEQQMLEKSKLLLNYTEVIRRAMTHLVENDYI